MAQDVQTSRHRAPSLPCSHHILRTMSMQYTTLGRTGLKVSVAGLGCGGSSKLGLGTGKSEVDAVKVVQRAMDLGVNLIDTARSYGTEGVVGQAIKGRKREELVVVTKVQTTQGKEIAPFS